MLRRTSLTVVLVLFSSSLALAGSGPYVGFHGGASGVDVELGEGRLRLKSEDFAWKAFGGVGLGRFLAVETGYVKFGSAEDTVAGVMLNQSLWGWDTAALVKLNLGPVDFYGRVGGIYWKATAEIGSTGLQTTEDGFDVNYGGGIGIILGTLAIRGEMVWNGIEPAGSPWLATAGITVGF